MMKLVWMVIVAVMYSPFAYASDWYVNMGLGATMFQQTTQNGTWLQEGQPYKMTMLDLSGKLGLGYRFSPEWAIEINALSFGQAKSAGMAVPDEYYEPEKHKPKDGAPKPNHFDARQRSYGGEIVALRSFHLGEFSPFLKLGGFATMNDMPYTIVDVPTGQTFQEAYKGYTVGIVGGGGVCYKWACAEASYYRGMGSSGYPISKSFLVPMLTLKIPL